MPATSRRGSSIRLARAMWRQSGHVAVLAIGEQPEVVRSLDHPALRLVGRVPPRLLQLLLDRLVLREGDRERGPDRCAVGQEHGEPLADLVDDRLEEEHAPGEPDRRRCVEIAVDAHQIRELAGPLRHVLPAAVGVGVEQQVHGEDLRVPVDELGDGVVEAGRGGLPEAGGVLDAVLGRVEEHLDHPALRAPREDLHRRFGQLLAHDDLTLARGARARCGRASRTGARAPGRVDRCRWPGARRERSPRAPAAGPAPGAPSIAPAGRRWPPARRGVRAVGPTGPTRPAPARRAAARGAPSRRDHRCAAERRPIAESRDSR